MIKVAIFKSLEWCLTHTTFYPSIWSKELNLGTPTHLLGTFLINLGLFLRRYQFRELYFLAGPNLPPPGAKGRSGQTGYSELL